MDACDSSRFSIRQGEGSAGHFSFESAPSNDLICAICMEPWQHAVELQPCGHIFCKECILQLPPSQASCPTCRSVPTGKAQPNRILRNMVEALCVTCDVCEWTGSMENYRHHPCTDKDFAKGYAEKKKKQQQHQQQVQLGATGHGTGRASTSREDVPLLGNAAGANRDETSALSRILFDGDERTDARGSDSANAAMNQDNSINPDEDGRRSAIFRPSVERKQINRAAFVTILLLFLTGLTAIIISQSNTSFLLSNELFFSTQPFSFAVFVLLWLIVALTAVNVSAFLVVKPNIVCIAVLTTHVLILIALALIYVLPTTVVFQRHLASAWDEHAAISGEKMPHSAIGFMAKHSCTGWTDSCALRAAADNWDPSNPTTLQKTLASYAVKVEKPSNSHQRLLGNCPTEVPRGGIVDDPAGLAQKTCHSVIFEHYKDVAASFYWKVLFGCGTLNLAVVALSEFLFFASDGQRGRSFSKAFVFLRFAFYVTEGCVSVLFLVLSLGFTDNWMHFEPLVNVIVLSKAKQQTGKPDAFFAQFSAFPIPAKITHPPDSLENTKFSNVHYEWKTNRAMPPARFSQNFTTKVDPLDFSGQVRVFTLSTGYDLVANAQPSSYALKSGVLALVSLIPGLYPPVIAKCDWTSPATGSPKQASVTLKWEEAFRQTPQKGDILFGFFDEDADPPSMPDGNLPHCLALSHRVIAVKTWKKSGGWRSPHHFMKIWLTPEEDMNNVFDWANITALDAFVQKRIKNAYNVDRAAAQASNPSSRVSSPNAAIEDAFFDQVYDNPTVFDSNTPNKQLVMGRHMTFAGRFGETRDRTTDGFTVGIQIMKTHGVDDAVTKLTLRASTQRLVDTAGDMTTASPIKGTGVSDTTRGERLDDCGYTEWCGLSPELAGNFLIPLSVVQFSIINVSADIYRAVKLKGSATVLTSGLTIVNTAGPNRTAENSWTHFVSFNPADQEVGHLMDNRAPLNLSLTQILRFESQNVPSAGISSTCTFVKEWKRIPSHYDHRVSLSLASSVETLALEPSGSIGPDSRTSTEPYSDAFATETTAFSPDILWWTYSS